VCGTDTVADIHCVVATPQVFEAHIPVAASFKRREAHYENKFVPIRIGFPVSSGDPSARRTFAIYATLPVENAGFPFLVDADFIVVTNRSQIQGHSAWNNLLQRGLFDALELLLTQGTALLPPGCSAADFVPLLEDVPSGLDW
jgi:hypothetical protein